MAENTHSAMGATQAADTGTAMIADDRPQSAGAPTHVPESSGLRLLAVHAHPDDESSKGAAMMAAYVHAGARVMVATATGGERGDLLNQAAGELAQCHRDLPGVRRDEMRTAAQALGIEHTWLGFADSGLPEGDPLPPLPFGCFGSLDLEVATAPLVRLIRRFKPHVITTYDENGGYPHPDHIMTHRISMEAYEAAGDPERYKDLGEPWQPQKLYYDRAFNPGRLRALHEGMIKAGHDSPYAERLARWDEGERPRWLTTHQPTTQIPVGDYFEQRDTALKAHRTQVEPDGFFFATPNEFLREVWPYDDFVLVRSEVPTNTPEYDLFAGLR